MDSCFPFGSGFDHLSDIRFSLRSYFFAWIKVFGSPAIRDRIRCAPNHFVEKRRPSRLSACHDTSRKAPSQSTVMGFCLGYELEKIHQRWVMDEMR